MPCFKAELCAPVIDQIVFRIKAAMNQLRVLVGLCPGHRAPLLNKRKVGGQERATDVLGQCKIRRPIARVPIIHKDAADAPRAAPMRDIEIPVGPRLELGVKRRIVRIEVGFLRGMVLDAVKEGKQQGVE